MKKPILAGLILVFLVNSIGFISYFYINQSRIKHEVKEKIIGQLPDSLLTVISVSIHNHNKGILWLNKKEFIFHKKLFDVVRTEQKGDSIFYYCFNDLQEEELFNNLDNLLADYQNNDNSNQTKKWWSFVKKYDQVTNNTEYLFLYPGKQSINFKPYIQSYYWNNIPVNTPPPNSSVFYFNSELPG